MVRLYLITIQNINMAFIIKQQKQEKSKLSNSELFEMFMIEIGQYTRLPDWGIALTWPHMSNKDATDKFKDWLKKK